MQPLRPGDPVRVGRYRVGGRLGSGGMGEVFWGRSPSGRPVAIKIVHRHLATQPEFRKRFAQEVDAARRVGGFHTASVVDADPTGDPPYLVTAYVEGPSLAEAIERNGPFPVPALRTLGAGLAEALEAVHAAGLVHRDLKPANVILAADGPRVIDFGIARALEGGGLTATGASIGTPRYMAPEQFGDNTVTGAADVFALGSVLCAAAGTQPFGTGSAATLVGAIMLRQPVLDGVPHELLPIVARCLDKDPARRPTPGQLLDELSDGTPSSGWLPPAVQAMLAEHALPDATVPVEQTQDMGSEPTVRLMRPTQQLAGPAVTGVRQLAAPPVPAPQVRRGPRTALVVAGVAAVLVAGGVVAAVALSSTGGQQSPGAGAPSTTTTAGPPAAVSSASVIGTWQSQTNNPLVRVEITQSTVADTTLDVTISASAAPECGGADATGTSTASLAGQTLATSVYVTCNGGTTPGRDYDDTFTYDPATNTLSDSRGLVFTRES